MTKIRIPLFESIFKQGLKNFKEPLGSAAYYTLLIEKFPTSFKACCEEATEFNLTPKKIEDGRDELLAKGLIAKIYQVEPSTMDFGREMYLPVNPDLVWEEYKETLNLTAFMEPEDIEKRDRDVAELSQKYTKKFGIYGIGAIKGTIIVYNSSQWLLFTIVNNLKNTSKLDLMLSGLKSFELPFRRYYERMLSDKNFEMRVLFDPSKMNPTIENNIKLLKDKSVGKLQIKKTPVKHVTSRRVILHDILAIDGKKILNREEPSYIGTIYFPINKNGLNPVEYLAENFNSTWDKGEDI